nr:MAG TPA: hypothetical protein [Caudoviricetes sp.]
MDFGETDRIRLRLTRSRALTGHGWRRTSPMRLATRQNRKRALTGV